MLQGVRLRVCASVCAVHVLFALLSVLCMCDVKTEWA